MNSAPFNGEPARVVVATPEQVAAIAKVVGGGLKLKGALLMFSCGPGGGDAGAEERILARGRLRYLPGFKDVWLGDTHYDLRERRKAQLCLEFLVESEAFDPDSAQHLVDDIDPYVRRHGDFPRASEIKLDDYFNDREGKLRELRKELVVSAGRDGRYFLRVE